MIIGSVIALLIIRYRKKAKLPESCCPQSI